MKSGIIRSLCLAGALTCAMFGSACLFHHHSRVYDSYYNDYHKWNDHEIGYYQEWCRDTHRDPGRDFRSLPPDDQEEYWKWRHTHEDHGHHHDKGQQ